MIHVFILSPLPALRAGLRALLSAEPEISVSGVASGLDGLPDDLDTAEMDVVVASGGLAVEALTALPTGVGLLLVTDNPAEVETLLLALPTAGERNTPRAWGAVMPNEAGEALQSAVQAVAEGLITLSPGLAMPLFQAGLAGVTPMPPAAGTQRRLTAGGLPPLAKDQVISDEPLTPREIDVLRLMAEGLTNKQIALSLGISEHTVKFHVSAIYGKMGAANRAEAVRRGARNGWLPI